MPPSSYYQRKLYALLHASKSTSPEWLARLQCWDTGTIQALRDWWNANREGSHNLVQRIAASSDRVNLHATTPESPSTDRTAIRHPISGEHGRVDSFPKTPSIDQIPLKIQNETDAERVFWWFWRFYPELWLNASNGSEWTDGLLYPAHLILPDCPVHSYQATTSAVAGALYPASWQKGTAECHPYLLIFTFSPIQDFIKASRKFLDFWAGSYLLHYLSARLCWHIAKQYGPDAIIVPSLWGQDIVDAFWLQDSEFDFAAFLNIELRKVDSDKTNPKTPVERFNHNVSTSLSTAGFPNVITALVPGLDAAKTLGQDLSDLLTCEWLKIGEAVRDHIRGKVSQEASYILDDNHPQRWNDFWAELQAGLSTEEKGKETPYRRDLGKWRSQQNQHGNPTYPGWTWNQLWQHQLKHSWEPYWAAVPLGHPQQALKQSKKDPAFQDWTQRQNELSQPWRAIPHEAEIHSFDQFNVGTWWGSFQQRLRLAIRSVKNTRFWHIPVAPGERSTISGQYSAVHPDLKYTIVIGDRGHGPEPLDFREGSGVPVGSMRLFWLLMSKAYPGLFSGSERLNALELTKRMAWIYGDVAEALGIKTSRMVKRVQRHRRLLNRVEREWEIHNLERFLYDRFVRFPNLSAIAAARFIRENRELTQTYCAELEEAIASSDELGSRYRHLFNRVVRIRPSHIPQTDYHINPEQRRRCYLNGVMFSAKWLSEDLSLNREQTKLLRGIVENTHRENGFKEGSPSDWWVAVLADGDGMGQYISGTKLKTYSHYINLDIIDDSLPGLDALYAEQKRMGPGTHIGLNRALLDFSNRLVPYLTEKRFCGKVIYSGGDDVMAVLPLEDLPGYLRSLRAAWSGHNDPGGEFKQGDGYWRPKAGDGLEQKGIPNRPLFTMGKTATMSIGVVIAYKTVPLPTVLENLWEAEGDRAKAMSGKDGICFRVIYGGGNTLEALMKGHLLDQWWKIIQHYADKLSPLLYRLADELPNRVDVTWPELLPLAAKVIMRRRDEDRTLEAVEAPILGWLTEWAKWAHSVVNAQVGDNTLGATSADLGFLLRFTAFWVDKMVQRQQWTQPFVPQETEQLTESGR